jgi:hypothetical protein
MGGGVGDPTPRVLLGVRCSGEVGWGWTYGSPVSRSSSGVLWVRG